MKNANKCYFYMTWIMMLLLICNLTFVKLQRKLIDNCILPCFIVFMHCRFATRHQKHPLQIFMLMQNVV